MHLSTFVWGEQNIAQTYLGPSSKRIQNNLKFSLQNRGGKRSNLKNTFSSLPCPSVNNVLRHRINVQFLSAFITSDRAQLGLWTQLFVTIEITFLQMLIYFLLLFFILGFLFVCCSVLLSRHSIGSLGWSPTHSNTVSTIPCSVVLPLSKLKMLVTILILVVGFHFFNLPWGLFGF